MNKVSIKAILSQYLSTLYVVEAGKEKWSFRDIFIQIVVPIFIGICSAVFGFSLRDITNLIAGVAIVSALLGAVAVFLFQVRMQIYDKMYPNGRLARGTIFDDDDIQVLDELFFAVMWCILEGMTICVVLIVSDCIGLVNTENCANAFMLGAISSSTIWCLISSLVAMIGCNLLLVLMMCMKRMARIYERFGMHKCKDKLSR